ncbi:PRAME family member 12-like [Tenrec ecaudatus]|uniref:PRAME family member 12-like n=1 Tax=Tenrec ecaudatus TaxID=94439 RepID=UPI003F59C5B7
MSSGDLPRLLDLAIQSVLQNEASVIAALEWLPSDLFPPLFKAAVLRGLRETVKAMVLSWPFTQLCLGALKEDCQYSYDILTAALDGLEMLLGHKVRPMRCKLKELDLRLNTDTKVWNRRLAAQSIDSVISSEEPETTQFLPPVRVLIDLCFQEDIMDEFLIILSERVKQGKALPPLYCRRVEFVGDVPQFPILEEILGLVRLDSVREVRVHGRWDLHDLNWLAPYLARMGHLHTICLSRITLGCLVSCRQEMVEKLLVQFTSHFLRLHQVQCLILEGVFLHGHLHQMLKCLQTPLKYLTINDCVLKNSDMTYLSCCPCTSNLKSLDLSGVFREGIYYAFFPGLLGRLSATLTHLALDSCGIEDSELMALQPALGYCTQLKSLALCGNPVSITVLLALLHYTMPRCQFAFLELPVPPHCYVGPDNILHEGTFQVVLQDLTLTLPMSRPHSIRLVTCHSRNGSDAIVIDIKP